MDNFEQKMLEKTYKDICEWGVVLYDETKRFNEHSERILFFDYFDMVYCCIVIDNEVKVCEYVSDDKAIINKMKMFWRTKE